MFQAIKSLKACRDWKLGWWIYPDIYSIVVVALLLSTNYMYISELLGHLEHFVDFESRLGVLKILPYQVRACELQSTLLVTSTHDVVPAE